MNHRPADATARLDALEMRIAHQDQMIAELNDVITQQWRKIDALERQGAHLREQFQNIGAQRDAPDQKPPHY